jgi:hypothetical protein
LSSLKLLILLSTLPRAAFRFPDLLPSLASSNMPLNQRYEAIEPWACEGGCQLLCHAIRIATSPRFLRIDYKCPTCQSGFTRYFDLEQRCYVVTGGRPAHSRNVMRYAGARQCLGQMHCLCVGIARSLRHASDCVRVTKLARVVSTKCAGLCDDELRQCFVKLFDMTPESDLFQQFEAAYGAKR